MKIIKIKPVILILSLSLLSACDYSKPQAESSIAPATSESSANDSNNNTNVLFQESQLAKSLSDEKLQQPQLFVLRSLAAFNSTSQPTHPSSQQAWQIIAAIPSHIINDAILHKFKGLYDDQAQNEDFADWFVERTDLLAETDLLTYAESTKDDIVSVRLPDFLRPISMFCAEETSPKITPREIKIPTELNAIGASFRGGINS